MSYMDPDRNIAMLSGEHDNVVLSERERQVVAAIELALLRDDPTVDSGASPVAPVRSKVKALSLSWVSPAHSLVVIGGLLFAVVLLLLLLLV